MRCGAEELPPWVTSADQMTPLLVNYDSRECSALLFFDLICSLLCLSALCCFSVHTLTGWADRAGVLELEAQVKQQALQLERFHSQVRR